MMPAPFACDMSAIPAAERPAHQALTRRLVHEALAELRELPDGFALRFAGGERDAVAAFVARERLCCPCLRFDVEVAPEGGPIWLSVTGDEGAKQFIQAEFGLAGVP